MIPLLFAFLIFLAAGTLCVGWPKRVQKFFIDACESGRWGFWIARNIILRRVNKPGYLIELRLIGIVSLCGAIVCAWAFFAPKR